MTNQKTLTIPIPETFTKEQLLAAVNIVVGNSPTALQSFMDDLKTPWRTEFVDNEFVVLDKDNNPPSSNAARKLLAYAPELLTEFITLKECYEDLLGKDCAFGGNVAKVLYRATTKAVTSEVLLGPKLRSWSRNGDITYKSLEAKVKELEARLHNRSFQAAATAFKDSVDMPPGVDKDNKLQEAAEAYRAAALANR